MHLSFLCSRLELRKFHCFLLLPLFKVPVVDFIVKSFISECFHIYLFIDETFNLLRDESLLNTRNYKHDHHSKKLVNRLWITWKNLLTDVKTHRRYSTVRSSKRRQKSIRHNERYSNL